MFSFKQIDLQKLPYSKILIVALTIISILAIKSCQLKNLEVTSSGVKIEMYKAQATLFKTEKNKLGEIITTQLAVITNKDKAVQDLISKNSTLQHVNTQLKFSSQAVVHDVLADYVQVKYKTDTVYVNSVPIGVQFSKKDRWYSISGSIQGSGVLFDSISFKDSITYNLGTKRKAGICGYFKPYDPTVEVISSNPYVSVKSLQNMTFVGVPKWYENRGVWFLAGMVSAGVGVYYIRR